MYARDGVVIKDSDVYRARAEFYRGQASDLTNSEEVRREAIRLVEHYSALLEEELEEERHWSRLEKFDDSCRKIGGLKGWWKRITTDLSKIVDHSAK